VRDRRAYMSDGFRSLRHDSWFFGCYEETTVGIQAHEYARNFRTPSWYSRSGTLLFTIVPSQPRARSRQEVEIRATLSLVDLSEIETPISSHIFPCKPRFFRTSIL